MTLPVALTIAGSDPSGGAGLQADLKSFHQHGVYGASVVSLLTVQNTQGVTDVVPLAPTFIQQQFDAVVEDLSPVALKTGALGDAANVRMVAQCIHDWCGSDLRVPVVVDPVMVSKHGHTLIDEEAIQAVRERLLPVASLVTPNRFEAAQLSGTAIVDLKTMQVAAHELQRLGARNVLIKGLPLAGEAIDLLVTENDETVPLSRPYLMTHSTHGSGCVLSATITARLAHNQPLTAAVHVAKEFVYQAIRSAPRIGKGTGPLDLHAPSSPGARRSQQK